MEGDAEYIFMSEFYQSVTNSTLENDQVHVIEVSKCFKRYLELAKLIKTIKIAVITDNDGDYKSNCTDNYSSYDGLQNVEVFAETDDSLTTF